MEHKILLSKEMKWAKLGVFPFFPLLICLWELIGCLCLTHISVLYFCVRGSSCSWTRRTPISSTSLLQPKLIFLFPLRLSVSCSSEFTASEQSKYWVRSWPLLASLYPGWFCYSCHLLPRSFFFFVSCWDGGWKFRRTGITRDDAEVEEGGDNW